MVADDAVSGKGRVRKESVTKEEIMGNLCNTFVSHILPEPSGWIIGGDDTERICSVRE